MKKDIIKISGAIFLFLLFYFPLNIPAQEQLASLVTLDLKEVDLKDALKIISQASNLNVVLDKDVKAKVNIALKDVPWDVALDNILKTNELTYRIQENIIRVMTLATVKKEEDTIPLTTEIITPNFAKAEELQASLSKMLSSRGSMQVNIPTNSLIINDTPEVLAKVEDLAKKLDIRTPQVMIEALIVSVKLTDTDKFGIDWTATHKKHSERKIDTTDLKPSGVLDLYYGKTILTNWNITAQLALFAEDKNVKILANPRIMTMDNLAAQIEITEQVPYTYTSQSTEGTSTVTSTQFKDVGIKLYVTPHITKDKFISMSVKSEQSFVASFVGTTNEPSIDSRKAETNLMLKDGETFVIGGLRKKDSTITIDKIPLFGDIPFLGKFFRKEVKEITDTDLLIFITPHVLEESLVLTLKEEEKLEKSQDELFGIKKERNKAILKTLAQLRQEEELTRKTELKQQREEETKQQELEAAAEKERQKQERLEKAIDTRLEQEIASLYKEAVNYYNHNQFPEAEHAFEHILILDPDETEAREYLEIKITQKKKN